MDDYEQAIVDLDKAIEIQANFGKAYYNRGLSYYAMGDYDQAIADLSKAVELSSNWHAPPTDYGSDPGHDLLAGFDNQMEAMQSYTDLPSVYHRRGLAYLAKEEYDSAISDLDMAISLQPDLSVAYYTRAAVHLSVGNHDKAKADCQTALKLGDDPEVQPLGVEVQTLCSLVVTGYDFSFSINGDLPTKAASDTPAEELLASSIAMYIPQPNETPTTPIWDNTQVPCDEKPLSQWGSSGIYHYRQAGSEYLVIEGGLSKQDPVNISCENILSPFCNFGGLFTEPPVVGNSIKLSSQFCSPPVSVITNFCNSSTTIVERGLKRTSLQTFQALKVNTAISYSFTTGVHSTYDIRKHKSEWYACGYGLIHPTASSGEAKDGITLSSKSSELTLVSFTPFSTNESHVRYILADIQLGNLSDTYRGNITDEETAESLRRWDAGIRVENIEEFERKIVNEQWQIVYAGTESTVIGIDVHLTSDSPQ
jgi:tetratricopeptide (TPR) repeat protein